MSDYIEREAVNALIKAECSPKVAAYLIDAVATIPAADVRPVVLCRDCDCGKDCYIKTILTEDCEVEEPFCAAGKPGCGADMREES